MHCKLFYLYNYSSAAPRERNLFLPSLIPVKILQSLMCNYKAQSVNRINFSLLTNLMDNSLNTRSISSKFRNKPGCHNYVRQPFNEVTSHTLSCNIHSVTQPTPNINTHAHTFEHHFFVQLHRRVYEVILNNKTSETYLNAAVFYLEILL
jgi:hypothetical protein